MLQSKGLQTSVKGGLERRWGLPMNSSVMRKTGLAVLVGLLGLGASSWADGFNPSLSPRPAIGESRICSSSIGSPTNCSAADSITVDWAVGFDVLTQDFIYFYG